MALDFIWSLGVTDQVVPGSVDDNPLQFMFYWRKFDDGMDWDADIYLIRKHQRATEGEMDITDHDTMTYSFVDRYLLNRFF